MLAATVAFDRELLLSHKPSHPKQLPYANTTYGVKARTERVMIESMMFRFNSIVHHDSTVPSVIGPGLLGLRNGSGPAREVVAIY